AGRRGSSHVEWRPDDRDESVQIQPVQEPVRRREGEDIARETEVIRGERLGEGDDAPAGRNRDGRRERDLAGEVLSVEPREVRVEVRKAEIEPPLADRVGALREHGT